MSIVLRIFVVQIANTKPYKGWLRVIKVVFWFLYLSVCFVVGTKTERLEEDSRKRIREGQR